MASFIADMIVYACPPAFVITMIVINLVGLRRAFKIYQEVAQRRFLPVELDLDALPAKLDKMGEQLRKQDFRYIGAYIDKFPTAKTQAQTPALAFVHDQLNLVAVCVLISGGLGKVKLGVLYTFYPGGEIIQTLYSLPFFMLSFLTKQSSIKSLRAGSLEKALIRHRKELTALGQQFGEAVVVREIDDLMNELNTMDTDTVRRDLRSSLSKAFLYILIAIGVMVIAVARYLIRYPAELETIDLVSTTILLMTLLSALVFSVYHYLALRRSTL